MRNLICVLLVVLVPLTLASDTQHRFKVYVDVNGNDDQAVDTIEAHLKRELRLLGDVDIVGMNDDWEFILEVFVMVHEQIDGTKSGNYVIGTYNAARLDEHFFKKPTDYVLYPTIFGILGAAYYSTENLHKFCINHVNSFDKQQLKVPRDKYKFR